MVFDLAIFKTEIIFCALPFKSVLERKDAKEIIVITVITDIIDIAIINSKRVKPLCRFAVEKEFGVWSLEFGSIALK